MKHLFNKLKSAFLVLMTVVISLPLSSFTAGAMAQPPSVDNPACDETVASGNITLCKTAQPVPGMVNTWDITLKIKSKKVTTTSDTVLVIDRSGSMDSNGRMPAAKTAARSFVNTLLPAGNTTNRIALVSFAGEVQTNSNFTNNADTLISAINGLNANGGTYTQAAIHEAQEILATSTADYKTIVLLSDGEPTYSVRLNNPDDYLIPYAGYGGQTGTSAPQTAYQYNSRVGSGSLMLWRYYDGWGNSNDKYYNHGNSTIAEAGFAKIAGDSTIYTVALEAGAQGNDVLNAVASPGNAYTANPADLQQIFDEIAGKISNFIKDASVVDQMGDGIIVKNGGKTINWTPTLTQEGDFFVAEKTYRIQLDGTKLVDGWYDANQIAALTYNGGQTANFPVPKVDPTFVKIEKKLDGDDCANCEFTFELTLPTNVKEFHSVKLGEVKTLYHPMPVGNYSIVETSAKDAGGNAMSLDQYDVSIVPATFALSQTGADVAVLATNKLKTTDVSVRKQWTGKPGTSATVTLHADGVATSHSIELNAGNDWKHTFTGLREHNRDGSLVKYTIVETPVAGYEASYSDDGLTVTNKYIPEKINITGKKVWTGGDNFNGGIRPDIKLQLKKNGVNEGDPVTLTHPNVEHPWTGLEETDIDGNEYIFTIKEVTASGEPVEWTDDFPYDTTYSPDGLTAINTYRSPLTSITGTKQWVNGNNLVRPTIELELYRFTGVNPAQPAQTLVPGSRVSLDAAGLAIHNRQHTWLGLDLTDEQGNAYTYVVREVGAIPNYETDYDDPNWTVINTYQIPKIEIEVDKTWVGGENVKPELVTINLLQDEKQFKTIELNAENNWRHIWKDLDETDLQGNKYTYTVEEVEVEDFKSEITGSTKDGFVITNKYISPEIDISVNKDWDGGQERPEITAVLTRVGDAEFKQTIILNTGNNWQHTWEKLAQADANGNIYDYQIAELEITDYQAEISKVINDDGSISFKINNKYSSPTADVTATKNWIGGSVLAKPDVTFQLYRNGVKYGELVTISTVFGQNTASHTWKNLPINDHDGVAYKYTVKETSIAAPWEKVEIGLEVTNTYHSPEIDITVDKTWVGGEKVRPEAIVINLLRNGEIYDTTELTADKLTHTWTVDQTDEDGNQYTYTVKEVEVEDFKSEITGSVEDGFTITNTYQIPTRDVNVKKLWVDRFTDHPAIEVDLLRNGESFWTHAAVLNKDNNWTFTWENVELTDEAGNAYAFTVEEITELKQYNSSIVGTVEDGFVITNTWLEPGKGGGATPIKSAAPDTGQAAIVNALFLPVAMLMLALGLASRKFADR